jgi:hypothetical protein
MVVIWSSPRMRDDDGRMLDHKTLEQLRIRAIRQIEQGVHPEEIGAALGMTRAAVYGWLAKDREGGLAALKARPVPGRPPKPSGAQLHRTTTPAPPGRRSVGLRVVASTGDRFAVNFAVNLISAVTAKGKLRFAAYDGNLNGRVFIDFCRRLLHDSPGPVFLVLDGHPCTAPTRLRPLPPQPAAGCGCASCRGKRRS